MGLDLEEIKIFDPHEREWGDTSHIPKLSYRNDKCIDVLKYWDEEEDWFFLLNGPLSSINEMKSILMN